MHVGAASGRIAVIRCFPTPPDRTVLFIARSNPKMAVYFSVYRISGAVSSGYTLESKNVWTFGYFFTKCGLIIVLLKG